MLIFRCVRGFLIGVFAGLLVVALTFSPLWTIFGAFMARAEARELANLICVPLWFGFVAYLTIKPVLEQQKENKERQAQSRLEESRKAQEAQRQREKTEAEAAQRRTDEEKSRSELLTFVRSIEIMPLNELQRLEKLKLLRADQLREMRNEEDQEHIAFLADPQNQGCRDAAMDHHRRRYHSIDTEVKQVQLELEKVREALGTHSRIARINIKK